MSNHDHQQREELMVFNEFGKVCPLPLILDTARIRPEPEPDILCELECGEMLAFELRQCEDVTKDDASSDVHVAVTKKLIDKMQLENTLYQAYREAVEGGRIDDP